MGKRKEKKNIPRKKVAQRILRCKTTSEQGEVASEGTGQEKEGGWNGGATQGEVCCSYNKKGKGDRGASFSIRSWKKKTTHKLVQEKSDQGELEQKRVQGENVTVKARHRSLARGNRKGKCHTRKQPR